MKRQLAIDLPPHPAFGRADFLVSSCNADAFGLIERWPDWPARSLVLYGPSGSGKSHLARLWCERSAALLVSGDELSGAAPDRLAAVGAVAIDDADRADERILLHLCNCITEAGAGLLLTGNRPLGAWTVVLPDLASRLRAMPAVGIAPPDDALLAAVLIKHFADRQLAVRPDVVSYLVPRMERSFAAAAALAARLDRSTLGTGRAAGRAAARQALAEEAGGI